MRYNDTIYYSDEHSDEFSGVTRNEKQISSNYKYINRNFFWNFAGFIVHRIFLTPISFLYCKFKFHLKIENKQLLKKEKEGYFLFGNHTQVPGDGYMQAVLAFPKKSYPIVNSDSVAIFGTENLMKMLGVLPLPSGLKGYRNFQNAMFERVNKNVVTIFPEAHIWPYYNKIRPFSETSFKYPVKSKKPSYCFTVTYQQRKNSKKANITIFVDGPFYPNENLKISEQPLDLRNRIYEKMCKHCNEQSYYEYIKYIHKDSTDD